MVKRLLTFWLLALLVFAWVPTLQVSVVAEDTVYSATPPATMSTDEGGDWCFYVKGGSADIRIEGNEIYVCDTGGFTAGQGTGFQFMTPPYLTYEAENIEFVGNEIHDTEGAEMGVNGGHNILLAENDLERIGRRSHLLEIGFGGRSCDGYPGDDGRDRCAAYLAQGGWGTGQSHINRPGP